MRLGLGIGIGVGGRRRFSPEALPDLAFDLDPARGITLGGGGGIASWADQAGKIVAPAQATEALQPDLTPNAINGAPVVSFTGAKHLTHALRMTKPCTIFAVMKTTATGAAGYAVGAVFAGGGAGVALFGAANAINQWGLYQGANVLSGATLQAYKICVAIVRDYNDVTLRTNGAAGVVVATGLAAYGPAGLIGCGLAGGGQNFEGSFARLFGCSRVASDTDVARSERFLASKYGLVLG